MTAQHSSRAKELYAAFAAADRSAAEALLADDFEFHSPPDPHLDRAGYFERCWPGAGSIREFDFVRLIEHGEEVVVTYEATRADGTRFRNTEVLTFDGDRVRRVEVYFGWDLGQAESAGAAAFTRKLRQMRDGVMERRQRERRDRHGDEAPHHG